MLGCITINTSINGSSEFTSHDFQVEKGSPREIVFQILTLSTNPLFVLPYNVCIIL